jgi:hypothetical protein
LIADLPQALKYAINQILLPIGMQVTNLIREVEGKAYAAWHMEIDGRKAVFRVGKATPKKAGYFVTVWQRPSKGAAYMPFHIDDGIDFVAIFVADGEKSGLFMFDKKILLAKRIFAGCGTKGKGGFRIYAPWSVPENSAALKAQEWQHEFFMPVGR